MLVHVLVMGIDEPLPNRNRWYMITKNRTEGTCVGGSMQRSTSIHVLSEHTQVLNGHGVEHFVKLGGMI